MRSRLHSPTIQPSSRNAARALRSASPRRSCGGAMSLDAADVLQSLRRSDHFGRAIERHQPLPHRQHLEREGARCRDLWRVPAGRQRPASARPTPFSTRRSARSITTSQAPSPYQVGDPLLRRPRHHASLDVTWTAARVTVFASLAARGTTLDAEPAFGPERWVVREPWADGRGHRWVVPRRARRGRVCPRAQPLRQGVRGGARLSQLRAAPRLRVSALLQADSVSFGYGHSRRDAPPERQLRRHGSRSRVADDPERRPRRHSWARTDRERRRCCAC